MSDLPGQAVVKRLLVQTAFDSLEQSAASGFTKTDGRAVLLDLVFPKHACVKHTEHGGFGDARPRWLLEIPGQAPVDRVESRAGNR